MEIALSFLVPFLLGYIISGLLMPRESNRAWSDVALSLSLAMGTGYGVSSLICFGSRCFLGAERVGMCSFELVTLFACSFMHFRYRKHDSFHVSNQLLRIDLKPFIAMSLSVVMLGLFIVVGICYGFSFATSYHGGWDGWAIWNLHARFMFRSLTENQLKDLFSQSLNWSHTDYPFLLPSLVARGWLFVRSESTTIPQLIAASFTFATVLAIISAVWKFRSAVLGATAGIIVLSSRLLIGNGLTQQADVPLSFYMLMTFVVLQIHDRSDEDANGSLIMAGFMAACAAWTKNEGLVFFGLILFDRILQSVMDYTRNRSHFRQVICFLAGAVLPLSALICFKLTLSPPCEFTSIHGSNALRQVFIAGRHLIIIKALVFQLWFLRGLAPFEWLSVALFVFLAGIKWEQFRSKIILGPLLILIGMMTSYYFAYLISPYDLQWHVNSSLSRLVVQVFPSIILLICLVISDELISPKSKVAQSSDNVRCTSTSCH